MIRTISRATLLLAMGVLVASAAMAGVPNAANSPLPAATAGIFITGNAAGTDPQSTTITVRDAANNTVANSVVVINFTNCNDYVQLANNQAGVNCGARSVSATTNGSGVAVFHISGVGRDGSTAPTGQFCASVTADGVPLGTMIASAFDVNAAGGVNSGDLSRLICAITSPGSCVPVVPPGYQGRYDLNRDNTVGSGDVSRMLACTTQGSTSISVTSNVCP